MIHTEDPQILGFLKPYRHFFTSKIYYEGKGA